MADRPFATSFNQPQGSDEPGLVLGDDNVVYLIKPDGSRVEVGGGSQPLLFETTDLLAADILALETPVEIIPNPGPGKVVGAVTLRAYYTFVTTPYTVLADPPLINYGPEGNPFWGLSASLLEQTNDAFETDNTEPDVNTHVVGPTSDWEDKRWMLYMTLNPTDGDSLLRLITQYQIFDLAT